jgi:hypothetical protein
MSMAKSEIFENSLHLFSNLLPTADTAVFHNRIRIPGFCQNIGNGIPQ